MSVKHRVGLLVVLILLSSTLTASQSVHTQQAASDISSEENLRQFAYVNCLFWYFKKMGYDTKDILSISGGIVELGSGPMDKYQDISLFIKNYTPDIKSKQQIDIDLLKCFALDKSTELNELINSREECQANAPHGCRPNQ